MPQKLAANSAAQTCLACAISVIMLFLSPALMSANTTRVLSIDASKTSGEELFGLYCGICHDKGLAEAPLTEALKRLTVEHISRSMSDGVMSAQSGHLSPEQRQAIASYLGQEDALEVNSEAGYCSPYHQHESSTQKVRIGDWGFGLKNARFIADSKISPANVGTLELDWAFAFPNASRARSQPTIAGNVIFTASQNGKLYALDLDTGCFLWEFKVGIEVRSAIFIDSNENGYATRLYFGDFEGNVYGFDIATRQVLWKIRADSHPVTTITGSPRLYLDTLYVPVSSREVISANTPEYPCCSFRGSILALDKWTGEERWRTYMADEPIPQGVNSAGAIKYGPSGAPIWSSPTVDEKRGLLYIGTGENYTRPTTLTSDSIMALSLENGAIEWINQVTMDDAWNGGCGNEDPVNCPEDHGPDYDFGAPPMLTTMANGKDIILAGQKSGKVYAMDPDNHGKVIWERRVGRGGIMGGIHWGMTTDGDLLYVPISDISVYPEDAHKPARSGMHALDVVTGEFIWYSPVENICGDAVWNCGPGLSAAATLTNGMVFSGGLDGVLRAFDTETGEVLWRVETNRAFTSVNGVEGEGGSFDSDGPVIVGDRLIVNSGYDKWGYKLGNVLLSYKLSEK